MEILKRVVPAYLQTDNVDVFIITARETFMAVPSQYSMIELPESYIVIY